MADAQTIIKGLVARGYSPAQAYALAGNIAQESSFNPTAVNPNEGAFGLLQWRLDRKTGLENYAKATGRDPADPEAQMDWLAIEMNGPEAKNAKAFLSAQDPQTASQALKAFIRYAPGSEKARLYNTLAYASQFDGDQQQQSGDTQLAQNTPLFANPAFGGAQMPSDPQWPGSVAQQPAQSDEDLLKAFSAPSGNASGGMSDDDLLKLFLEPQSSNAPNDAFEGQYAKAISGNRVLSDAEKQAQFFAMGGEAPSPEPSAVPGVQTQQSDDDKLLQSFLAPQASDGSQPPAGAKPGSKAYADWALERAKAGKPIPQVSETPPELFGGTEPGDRYLAASSAFFNSIPVAGPSILGGMNAAKAAMYGVPVEQIAQQNAAVQQMNPDAAAFGGGVGSVLPLMAAGVSAPALFGGTGPVAQQMLVGGASNALLSGADTLARGGSAQQAGENALIGGAIGAAIPGAFGAGGKVVNALIGKTSPETAQLAKTAIDQYGIPITPAQMSESPMIRFAESVVNKMPFTGGTASIAEQQAAFNKAVASTIGETADKITPDVMAAAKDRLGKVFDSVATNTPRIAADPTFDSNMLSVMTDAQQVLTPDEFKPLLNQFDNIMSKFQQGGNAITGEVYQALTRKGAPLELLSKSANPNMRAYASQIRNVLDDALERSASPDVIAQLRQARSQWKAMKTIEDLVEKSPTGDISPALLMNAARSSYSDIAYGGGGTLADLGRIGQKFIKPMQSSGTAERLAVMNMLTKLGGAGGLAATAVTNPGALPMLAAVGGPAALGTLGAAKGLGALMRSKGLANALLNNSLGIAPQATDKVGNMLLRVVSGQQALDQNANPTYTLPARNMLNQLMGR